MKIVESRCCARAGLLGNPADGYHGKAISFAVHNFFAEVQLKESPTLCFESADEESVQFVSLNKMKTEAAFADTDDGGNRLLQSALLRVLRHFPDCAGKNSPLFRVAFSSTIPRQVGMAGSSAIVIAAIKAYAQWFEIKIEPEFLASMALAAERDLGISAGLQDRVVQSLEGLVYMDFDRSVMRARSELPIGHYVPLDLTLLKNTYIAYANNMPESTDVLHSDLQARYESGNVQVVSVINEIAELARQGKDAIANGNIVRLAELINLNFDLRRSICLLHPGHVQMVELARDCGASAKYCGSGGAVVGTFPDISVFEKLNQRMQAIDCVVFRPEIY